MKTMHSKPIPHNTFPLLYFLFNFLLFIHPSYTFISSIPPEAKPTKSGYISINSSLGSSLFYAFYEAQRPITSLANTPLLFWLDGGPGCSSMLANFNGVGPWRVRVDPSISRLYLEPNEGAWNRRFGVVFIDNPVGTGFSVASSKEEIPSDQDIIAESLYIALKNFLQIDPLFKNRPVYLTGESYAGKYIMALGYYIAHQNRKVQQEGDQVINLVGFAIGSGLIDPLQQLNVLPQNAYFMGLINEKQKWELNEAIKQVSKMVFAKRWVDAADGRNKVFEMVTNMTGLATLFNFELDTPYEELALTERLLVSPRVKKAMGANPRTKFKECNLVVKEVMKVDVMKSVRNMVDFILNEKKYKVMFYEGQKDLKEGVVTVEAWMKKMKWSWLEKFMNEDRKVWKVKGNKLAGYVQSWGQLAHVVVFGAGHFVAIDQPLNAQALIEDWVLESGLFGTNFINQHFD